MHFPQLSLVVIYSLLLAPTLVTAQIIEDNSLSTEVETDNNLDFTVNTGEQIGDNLFHSFEQFSIPSNGSVFFNNPITIQNIISRVTGASLSEINGLIQSNGTANLFLINPNGIIFGENAELNIGGSFVGTTAESLFFTDGTEFSTNLTDSRSLLTVSRPLGLQFGSNPGAITNQADQTSPDQPKLGLTTLPSKTLALLGGNITFDGGATTAALGNIQIGSVAENSLVTLEPVTKGWQINYEAVSQFRDIKLDNLALIDTSGEGGGNINVTGRNIQLLNGSAITSNTLGNIDGGTIEIQASNLLEINGSDITGTQIDPLLANIEIFLPAASQIASNTFGSGEGGEIQITTQDLQLTNGGGIVLQTLPPATGKGGELTILATGSIRLRGIRPLLGVGDNAINFVLPSIDLNTAIQANQASEISTASISSSNGGDINLTARQISLEDGASIASSPFNEGDGGNILINASESIEVFGTSLLTDSASATISANTFSTGNAGNINISTKELIIQDGGLVFSSTTSLGNAGNIEISTSSLEIVGVREKDQIPSLISTETVNGGDGGNIALNTDSLVISDRASLSVQGSGDSVPGNLTVNAGSIELNNFASITAETEFEAGGNIQLNIQDRLTLRENSLISAEAFNAANGGNLDIDARFIVALPQENNDILANAAFGNGGNIEINTEGIFGIEEGNSNPPNLTNDIDASSEFGSGGTVSIFFPSISKVEGTFQAPPTVVDAESLFKNSFCKVRGDSKFIATGRNGIPLLPDDALFPANNWSDWRMIETEEAKVTEAEEEVEEATKPQKIVMIQGWITDSSGNVVLTDQPLAVASRKPGLNAPGCNQLRSQK